MQKKIIKSGLQILILLLVGSFCVYSAGSSLAKTGFYLFVFIMFFRSKNIIFWTVVLFLLLNNPWGLFYYRPNDWIFQITSTMGVSYTSLYGFVFLLKGYFLKKTNMLLKTDYLKSYYRPFVFYAVFLLFWGLVYGHSLASLYMLSQYFPSLLLFIFLPRMFRYDQLIEFNRMVFVFSIIHTLGAFADIISAGGFINLFTFGQPSSGIAYGDDLIRIVGGITISFYSLIISLFYLANRENSFKNWYLWLVALSSWLFILSSATRGWMLSSSLILIFFLIYFSGKSLMSGKTLIGVLFIVLLGAFLVPRAVKKNLSAAFDRLKTVEAVVEGDMTAGGTAIRWDVRGPKALTQFHESPIFGFGFSKISAKYYDEHVGNHSLLLVGGILGLIIVWLTAIAIVRYLFFYNRRFYKKSVMMFSIAIIAVMLIHSTSRSMLSFFLPADSAFLIALLFNHVNTIPVRFDSAGLLKSKPEK